MILCFSLLFNIAFLLLAFASASLLSVIGWLDVDANAFDDDEGEELAAARDSLARVEPFDIARGRGVLLSRREESLRWAGERRLMV